MLFRSERTQNTKCLFNNHDVPPLGRFTEDEGENHRDATKLIALPILPGKENTEPITQGKKKRKSSLKKTPRPLRERKQNPKYLQ